MFQCLMNLWALQCHVFFQESRKKPVCSVHLSPHAGMVQGSPQSPDVIPPVTNDVPSPRWALVPPHRGLQQVRSKKGGHPNHTDGVMQSCPSQLLAEHNQREPLLRRQVWLTKHLHAGRLRSQFSLDVQGHLKISISA